MAEENQTEPEKVAPKVRTISNASVHPLVLLSVVDHFTRSGRSTNRRCVGTLLGSIEDGVVEITNAFAVPFDEDRKDSGVYFLDHAFNAEMAEMFKRVNASEIIIGWYHTGPKLKPNDIEIHQTFRQYVPDPILLVVDTRPETFDGHELPCKAYLSKKTVAVHSVEEVDAFYNLDVNLVASAPEEVGVEHVLRDVQDHEFVPNLTGQIRQKMIGLEVLHNRMDLIREYLQNVAQGKMPLNQDILYLLQQMFNVMPDITTQKLKNSLIKVMNDQQLSIYIASIVRTILSLDQLITNRYENKEEPEELEKKAENEDEKAKDTTDTTKPAAEEAGAKAAKTTDKK